VKRLPNETYDQWLERISRTEADRAIRQYVSGKDIETIMQEMSYRILKKCLDPINRALKESSTNKQD